MHVVLTMTKQNSGADLLIFNQQTKAKRNTTVTKTGDNFFYLRINLFLFFCCIFLSTAVTQKVIAGQEHHHTQPQPIVRIAVASNFSPVLEKLLPQFTRQTNIPTQIISGATGVLFQQIKHGAPFDIFLAADSRRPQQLSDDKLIVDNSLQTYAIGKIAFWSSNPKDSEKLNLKNLTSGQIKPNRFAIANPNIAPYGKAAKQALIALKLWKNYQTKLITGININQTFQQIRSGAVTMGIVANSQLKINGLSGIVIPQKYYQPIEQQLVILQASKHKTQALQLKSFLLSKKIQQEIVDFGYAVKNLKDNHLKDSNLKEND